MWWMRSKRFWKVTSGVIVAIGVPFLVTWWWLLGAISRSPLQPIPPANVVPFNNHGHDVYITRFQAELLAAFYGPLGVAYALLIVLALVANWVSDKSSSK